MSDNKRYFWLKLNENFFEDDTIAWIEEQDNGKDYIIFYLKLALKSLTDDGYLIRYVGEKLIPYDVKALAKLTNTDADTVRVAMNLFLEVGILSQLESGEIYLNQIDEMIGSETESAKRVRKHRAKQNLLQSNGKALQSNTEVTKCNTEIEIEKEKELEIDKELDSPAKAEPHIPFKEIIEHLNHKTNSNYRHTTKATQQIIKARFNEGFTLNDFIKVIDIKTNEWINDNNMAKYLRPQTLFGTKFESYLNQSTVQPKQLGHTADAPTESSQVKYDDDELEYANNLIEKGVKQFNSLNAEEQKQLNAWRQRNAIPLLEMG